MENLNPVSVRQHYLKQNAQTITQWIEIYGQPMSLYRFISSEIPNTEKARRVYGSDRVTSNISKLTFIREIKIPVAFDDLVAAHSDRAVNVEFTLANDELKVNDILMLDYLGQKLEFVVQEDLGLNTETLFKYTIKTRSSQNDLGGHK